MNRIDRISAILIHLQGKRVVKASELASRFDVSKRTIYRDIKTLEEAGVPVGGEAGVGFYLAEGYHLPPVSLTREEAGAFLVASKLVEKHSDFSINKHFVSGLAKIRSVLGDTDKTYLENIEQNIAVLKYEQERNKDFPNHFLNDIMQAISLGKVVQIQYYSAYKQETTIRQVEPYNVWFYSMNWHLIGYCRKRKNLRDFRLDRIRNVQIMGHNYEKPKGFTIDDYFKKMITESELHKVTLLIDLAIYSHIQNSRYYFGFIREEKMKGAYRMHFMVNDLRYLAKWVVSLDDKVEIEFPEKLKALVLRELEVLNAHYQKK